MAPCRSRHGAGTWQCRASACRPSRATGSQWLPMASCGSSRTTGSWRPYPDVGNTDRAAASAPGAIPGARKPPASASRSRAEPAIPAVVRHGGESAAGSPYVARFSAYWQVRDPKRWGAGWTHGGAAYRFKPEVVVITPRSGSLQLEVRCLCVRLAAVPSGQQPGCGPVLG